MENTEEVKTEYEENTAGSLMSAEFINLKSDLKVSDAFYIIRKQAIDDESIYTCYVTDDEEKLIGLVTVRQLFNTGAKDKIADIMKTNILSVNVNDENEEIANLFTKYGFISIPVVDDENRMLGIVTAGDALTVMEEEATEDLEIMAAITPSDDEYMKTKPFKLALNRIVWLMILMIAGLITGLIIGLYDSKIKALAIASVFIPLLMSSGGNAGSQTSTLITRGMAVGEIETKDFWRVLWKEVRVALLIIPVLAALGFGRVLLSVPKVMDVLGENGAVIVSESNLNLAWAVALSLGVTILFGKLIGAMLPILAKKVKLDPAVMASPILTTLIDTFSVVVYFSFIMLFVSGMPV